MKETNIKNKILKKATTILISFLAGFILNSYINFFPQELIWKARLKKVTVAMANQEKEIAGLKKRLYEKNKYLNFLELQIKTNSLQKEIYKDSLDQWKALFYSLLQDFRNYVDLVNKGKNVADSYLKETGLDSLLKLLSPEGDTQK